MATKAKPKKSVKKQHTPEYYPVQRSTPIGVNGASLTGRVFSDAGRLLSATNRRLYRYGMNYQIKIDLDIPPALAADQEVVVYALRNNWDVQRAFALAKKTYEAAMADERSIAKAGRWEDFRVETGVVGSALAVPVAYDNSTLGISLITGGEFAASRVDKGGVETFFTWGSATATSLDIIDEWTRSGITGTDPTPTLTTTAYDGVNSDDLSNTEMQNLQDDGNLPPYTQVSDSDQLVKVATLRWQPTINGEQRLSTGYFDAPCGVFLLEFSGNIPNGTVSLTAKAGDYKGVAAHKMCQ